MIQNHVPPSGNQEDSIFDDILGRENWGHREAIIEQALTYGEVLAASEELGKVLVSIGAGEGTLVGICLCHCAEYVESLIAIYLTGGISVLLSPFSTADERHYILQNSAISYLITQDPGLAPPEISSHLKNNRWNNLYIISLVPHDEQDLSVDDRMIIYTSGSTSQPKGVVLTEKGISSNVRAVSNYLGLSPQDRSIVFTPPAYAYAMSQVLTHFWAGGSILPWPHGLMYPFKIFGAIEKFKLTGISANPTSFRILTKVRARTKVFLDTVRYVMSGGQPLDRDLALNITRDFQMARIVNMYGCTENSPRISFHWLPTDVTRRETQWPVGIPISGTEIRIANESKIDVPRGNVGNVLVGGKSLMRCYWKDPQLSQRRLSNGWFDTGDLGFIDFQGNLNLVGRRDNIINVGHEKVSPEEVETVIEGMNGVLEVGVAPIDDHLLGNVPVALIVLEDNENEKALDLIKTECIRKLSSHKLPRQFVVVTSLPKTLYGKIDRRKMGEIAHDIVAKGRRTSL